MGSTGTASATHRTTVASATLGRSQDVCKGAIKLDVGPEFLQGQDRYSSVDANGVLSGDGIYRNGKVSWCSKSSSVFFVDTSTTLLTLATRSHTALTDLLSNEFDPEVTQGPLRPHPEYSRANICPWSPSPRGGPVQDPVLTQTTLGSQAMRSTGTARSRSSKSTAKRARSGDRTLTLNPEP